MIVTFLLFSALNLEAQPIITLKAPLEHFENFNKHIVYYGDSANRNAHSIANDSSIRWLQPEKKSNFNFGISQKIYWLKFSIQNEQDVPTKYFILLHNKAINEAALYQSIEGKILQAGITGDHQPFYERTVASNHLLLPIIQPAKSSATYYLRLNKKGENLNFKISIINQNEYLQKEDDSHIYIGFFSGIIFLTALLNIFLFVIFRDKITLWYSLYNLMTIVILWIYEGMDLQYIYFHSTIYPDISRYIAGSLGTILLIYIMQLFTEQNKKNSKYYGVGTLLKGMIAVMIPVTLLVYTQEPLFIYKKIHFTISILLQVLGMLFILVSCIEKIRQQYKPAYFYLAAVLLLLSSSVLATLSEVGYFIHFTFYTPNLFQLSFVVEVILMSVGIIYKYYLTDLEKKKLTNEITNLKISSIRNILEARQKEQKRIASDLHDQLGGELAVIKLSLLNMQNPIEEMPDILKRIDSTAANARSIAHNLIPTALQEGSLAEIIASQTEQLNSNQQIAFSFHQTGAVFELTKDQEILLYRVILELIQNILKHSEATEAWIQLFYSAEELEVSIEDNGKGIAEGPTKGIGLSGIQAKVKEAGGLFNIESTSGSTLIIIKLPKTS